MKKLRAWIRRVIAAALRDATLPAILNQGLDIPGIDEAAEQELIRNVLEAAANHFDPDVE